MITALRRKGAEVVESIEDADVVIVNTCIVREETEQRMIHRIKTLHELCMRTGKKLIVAGCIVSARPYLVSRIAPQASMVAPQCAEMIWEAVSSNGRVVLLSKERRTCILPDYREGLVATIPIADGCIGDCSFCVVKLARRRLKSYPKEKIIEAVKKHVESGAVEVRLCAQDTASYGLDRGKRELPELVTGIAETVEGDYMIRIGMMNPDTLEPILDEIVEVLRNPRVYKFLHIPVQSGDDRVLKIMNRRYTVDQYRSIVKELRRKVPSIAIATDIIVGHPGEDEEAFENTIALVRDLMFDRVHVAMYTPRPRTVAAGLEQVPLPVRSARTKKMMKVVEEVCLKVAKDYLGSRCKALVVERGHSGTVVARLPNYYPVIVKAAPEILGKRVAVEIVDATFYDLRGAVLENL